jgi:hypothetical protein
VTFQLQPYLVVNFLYRKFEAYAGPSLAALSPLHSARQKPVLAVVARSRLEVKKILQVFQDISGVTKPAAFTDDGDIPSRDCI